MQPDEEIYDYKLRLQTIDYLSYAANKSKATGRPFYVQCGFRKPHAPWQYPQRMWDLVSSLFFFHSFLSLVSCTPAPPAFFQPSRIFSSCGVACG